MRSPTVPLLGMAILMVGCGAHQHRSMGTTVDHSEIFSRVAFSDPLPGADAHLSIAPTGFRKETADIDESDGTRYEISQEGFDRTLAEALMATGGFESVTLEGDPDAGRTKPGLILQLDLRSQGLSFEKRTLGNYVGIFSWLFVTSVPFWWSHDEIYRLHFDGKATILDGKSRDVLQEVDLGQCDAEEALSFLERNSSMGPYFLTLFVPPTALPPDPDALLEALLPAALVDAMGDLRDGFEAINAPKGLQIWWGETEAISFDLKSPAPGTIPEGKAIDLELDIVFPRDARDLAKVTVNGEVVLEYPKRQRPRKKRVTVEQRGVAFSKGEIQVAVHLDSQMEPIEAVIWVDEPK